MGLKNYYAQFMAMALMSIFDPYAVRKTRVEDIKLKSKEDRENDYQNLIKDRRAIPKTDFVKSPSQVRFAQKNYETRMAKKSIEFDRAI
jgi:hypothetical protein